MPTVIGNMQQDCGALTVIFDAADGKCDIKEKIEAVYGNPQEYLYFTSGNETAVTVLKEIREKSHSMDIIMPANENIIFFYFLQLKDLTNEWVRAYIERAEILAKQFTVAGNTQHQHICCFTYEGMDLLDEEQKRTVAGLLRELLMSRFAISAFQEIYLLYATGTMTLEGQSSAMVRLLHLKSRRSYFSAFGFDPETSKYVRVISQSVYYEGQALALDNRIREIQRWQTEEFDQNYIQMASKIKEMFSPLLARMDREQKEFRNSVQLYPVNIRNYKKGFMRKYQCLLEDKEHHPIVKKRKTDFMKEKIENMVGEFRADAITEFAKKTLSYHDMKNLVPASEEKTESWEVKERTLKDTVFQMLSFKEKNEELRIFAEQLYEKLEEELKSCVEISQEMYEKYNTEKKRCMQQKQIAGKFKNLSDCCSEIVNRTEYAVPKDYPMEGGSKLMVLVNGEMRSKLINNELAIAGCSQVHVYPPIEPAEIVCMKVGNYIKLSEEASQQKLQEILV